MTVSWTTTLSDYAKARAQNGEPFEQQIHLAWIQARNRKISDFSSLQQSGTGSK